MGVMGGREEEEEEEYWHEWDSYLLMRETRGNFYDKVLSLPLGSPLHRR